MAIRPGLDRLLERRENLKDRAVEEFDQGMRAVHENISRRISAACGFDPDLVFPPDGDDGTRVGRTPLEERLEALDDFAQRRAATLLTTLAEVEELLEASGLDKVRSSLRDTVGTLAGLAENTFTAQGVSGGAGALDTIAAEARLGGWFETAINEGLLGAHGRTQALKIKEALSASLGFKPVKELAQNLAAEMDASLPQRLTEARTRMAQADRVAHQIITETLEEDGDEFLIGYTGPPANDKAIRPFCSVLTGKAFTKEQVASLDNGQTSITVAIAGGGYNCRHNLVPVLADEETLQDLGLILGTDEDIDEANGAAAKARKRKGRK
tara:strand:- start:16572 stop:17549 length:978 start_codon:yes stop_codon:yes gene_type:complete